MYGIFTYIYHKNQLNVGKYPIHGSYGKQVVFFPRVRLEESPRNMGSKIHAFGFWRFLFRELLKLLKDPNKKIGHATLGCFHNLQSPRLTRPSPTKIPSFRCWINSAQTLGIQRDNVSEGFASNKNPCFEQPGESKVYISFEYTYSGCPADGGRNRVWNFHGGRTCWWLKSFTSWGNGSGYPLFDRAFSTSKRWLFGISEPSTVSLWAKNDSFFNMSR